MSPRTRIGPALGLAALCAGTTWFTLLSWRILTSDAASVTMPLFLLAIALAVGGATARTMRVPAAVIVLSQVAFSAVWLLFVVTSSVLPTGAALASFGDALSAGLESARLYEAPVPPNVPPVHALLLVGGTLTLLATDFLACTLRRVPLAGLVLLAAYSVPVSVTGEGPSWWTFVLISAGFLSMMFIAHEDQVTRWGREVGDEDADPTGFGARTGAVRGSAVTIGATATAMAIALPVLIPTLDVALFDGNGPGKREIEVADPMVDLRRDLSRGQDIPLVYVTTPGDRPTYLRLSVLTRFNGDSWTPGDRDIPETQVARGQMPPLDGVDVSVPRDESPYHVRVSPDFASTWLPTTAQVSDIRASGDWRYDTSTMDFISADDEVTTAGKAYDFTGVTLTLDGAAMDRAVSGATDVRSAYLEVPPSVSSEVRTLAAAVTGGGDTRFRKARALQQWFREDGGFEYDDTAIDDSQAGDLDAFLDESGRQGYCEQFAASMAIMARIIGIPARVAVGFLEPRSAGPNTWEFSSHDLHAWPELYFPGSGWVRFEPTPGQRAETVPTYTRGELPAIEEPSVSPGATRSSEALPDRGQSPTPDTATSADDEGSPVPWLVVAPLLVVLLLIALVLLLPGLLRRRRREERLAAGVEEAWAELRDLAVDLGHGWPGGRSPRAIGAWLGERLGAPGEESERSERPRRGRELAPEGAAALDRLVLELEESRYARSSTPGDSSARAADIGLIEEALVAGVSPRTARRARRWPRSLRPMPHGASSEVVTRAPEPDRELADHAG
ncbi:transglutaminase family protein [Nocardioides sp. P5_C9_2]